MEVLVTFLFLIAAILFLFAKLLAKERKRAAQEARLHAIELSDIDNMDGLSFEHYVANLLQHEGFTQVEVTKGSGDFGVDVIASKGSYRYAIQVKRTSGAVSRRAVSDAVAGKSHYSCNAAMVVTNGYLSRQSKEFACSVRCEIIDRDILAEWIMRFQASGPNQPTVRRAAEPMSLLQQDPVSESRLPSQQPEDLNPSGISSEVLTSIKAQTAADHPSDFSTQAYVVKEQIEAFNKLGRFRAPGMPKEVLSKVLEKAAQDHPVNYSTQLYVIEDQVQSYLELARLSVQDVPAETLAAIKEEAAGDHQYDFSTQLYVVKDQIESFRALGRLK